MRIGYRPERSTHDVPTIRDHLDGIEFVVVDRVFDSVFERHRQEARPIDEAGLETPVREQFGPFARRAILHEIV